LDALPYVCVYVRSRGGNSLDRDVTLNSVMQLDADSVLADGLDRLGDLDGPLLEGGATGLPDCQRNIARSHGPEQTTVLADLDSHLDDQVLQLRADLLSLLLGLDLLSLTGASDVLDLGLSTARPLDGVILRQQVVTAITVLDLDDVTGATELGHRSIENELNVFPLLSEPSRRTGAVRVRVRS